MKLVANLKEILTEEVKNSIKNKKSDIEDLSFEEKKFFREKVRQLFESSTTIKKSKIEDEFYFQDGVKFLLKHLIKDEISNKPYVEYQSDSIKKTDDALAPPYEDGQLIEEDFAGLGTHSLIFNKYAVMNEHVVLVTRNFSSQYKHLTEEDLNSALHLMKMLDGLVFFNGGKEAGSSQPRKHLQSIPLNSMYNGDFGLFLLIRQEANLIVEEDELISQNDFLLGIYKIKQLNKLPHFLIKFKEVNIDTLHLAYNIALLKLNLIEDEENIVKNYSVLFYDDWLLIVKRERSRVSLKQGFLDINSIGFLFTILLKSPSIGEELKSLSILEDIYSLL